MKKIERILRTIAPYYYAKSVISKILELPDDLRIDSAHVLKNMHLKFKEHHDEKHRANYAAVLRGEKFSEGVVYPIVNSIEKNNLESTVRVIEKIKNNTYGKERTLMMKILNSLLSIMDERTSSINQYIKSISAEKKLIEDTEKWSRTRPESSEFWKEENRKRRASLAELEQGFEKFLKFQLDDPKNFTI